MHAIKQLALVAAVAVCAAAPHFVAAQTKAPPRGPLFVQSANGVAFKDGVLSLKDVSPTTIFFADRPERAIDIETHSFLTTTPNALVATINHERMPVLLTREEEFDTWLHAPVNEAFALAREYPPEQMRIVQEGPFKEDRVAA